MKLELNMSFSLEPAVVPHYLAKIECSTVQLVQQSYSNQEGAPRQWLGMLTFCSIVFADFYFINIFIHQYIVEKKRNTIQRTKQYNKPNQAYSLVTTRSI